MTENKRVVVHEIKLTTGTKLLAVAGILALLLHTFIPLMQPDTARADSFKMTCSGKGEGPPGFIDIQLTCQPSN